MFLPSRMTRYVWSELLPPATLALMLYTFVMVMNLFFVVAEKSLSKNLGWELTVRLFLSGIPELLGLTIPMATLLGVMIGIGRLSSDHEWVALQSVGRGPGRLLWPVVVFGLAASVLCGVVWWVMVPRAHYLKRSITGELLVASNLASDLKPGVFYDSIPDIVMFVEDIRKAPEKRLRGVLLIQRDRIQRKSFLFVAKAADIYPDPDEVGMLVVDLYDGTYHGFEFASGETYEYSESYETFRHRMDAATYLRGLLDAPRDKRPTDMLWRELLEEHREKRAELEQLQADVAAAGVDRGNRALMAERQFGYLLFELNRRAALPLACLVFSVLALPLGITRVRSGKGAGFALSLGVILLYWVLFTITTNQSLNGKWPGWLGPWVANLALIPWALVANWRLHRPAKDRRSLLGWVLFGFRMFFRGVRRVLSWLRPRRGTNEPDPLAGDEADELIGLTGTPSRFIGRFDGYVMRTYLRIVLLTMSSVYLIYGLVEFKNMTGDLARTKQSPWLMLDFFQYFAPGALNIVLPVSCLVGAVVTFTVLTRTGELTAIKASGVSMRRATVPVIALTIVGCVTLFFIDDYISPRTNQLAQEVKDQIKGRGARTYRNTINGRWGFGEDGTRLYHYERYDTGQQQYRGVTIYTIDRENSRVLDHRYASRARWTGTDWHFEDGWYRDFPVDGSPRRYETFDELTVSDMEPPENMEAAQFSLGQLDRMTKQMSLAEIQSEIDDRNQRGYDTTRLQVQYWSKVANAASPLVMVLLGLPFAFKVGRKGSLYGVGVSLVLVLVYWATFAMFNALGVETLLKPLIAAFGPNVLFGLLGFYLMLYIRT